MNFPDNGLVGLLLVVFAKEKEDVSGRVQMVRETLSRASEVRHPSENCSFFSRCDIMTPSDPNCDERDCGRTWDALQQFEGVSIHTTKGDPFVFSQNQGLAHQLAMGCRFTLTLSLESRGYMNQPTMDALWHAVTRKGALAAGGILPDLHTTVEHGRLASALALWNTTALLAEGGFDVEAARGSRETNRYLISLNVNEQPIPSSRVDGVAEVVPLARMASRYGRCITAIKPTLSEGFAPYHVSADPELYERHVWEIRERRLRQDAHMLRAGFDPDILKQALLP